MKPRIDVLILAVALAGGSLAAAPRPGPGPALDRPAGDVSRPATGLPARSKSGASHLGAQVVAADAIPSASNTASETDLRLRPRLTAIASWYRDPRKSGLYAAMPAYRWGMKPWRVEVCTATRCVVVRVSDHCQCWVGTRKARGIDLSPAAFARLSPLSRGLVRVTIRRMP